MAVQTSEQQEIDSKELEQMGKGDE